MTSTLGLMVFLLIFSVTTSAQMSSHDYTARNGAPLNSLFWGNKQSDSRLPGITFLRPVMSGVLYRSGIGNVKTGLSQTQLKLLCEAGFSKAVIVDFKDGEKNRGTISCGNQSLEYSRVTSRKGADAAMQLIYNAIVADEGPVMAHCRNGVHASNAISAKALVRFCGWSISDAKAYWEATRNNSPCSNGCGNWINDKFAGFKEGDGGMPLTAAQKASFCP